jgi:hypothetical protein
MGDLESIRDKRTKIEHMDRQMRTEALRAISAQNKSLFDALYKECEAVTGHKFKFDHFNFNHTYRWYKCEYCGVTRGENEVSNQNNY